MTRFGAASLRRSPACRLAARLALLFFALRAILPTGYMPELGALAHGEVRIVICTGSGTQALLVDEAGKPVDDGAGDTAPHAAAGHCAFGMAAAQTLALPATMTSLALSARRGQPRSSDEGRALAQGVSGPPLGSRAPPNLLG